MNVGRITYYTFDLTSGTLLAELPFTSVTWSQALNAAGTWSGSLNLADPEMKKLNAIAGTATNTTLLIADIDGVIMFGGIVSARPSYDSSQRILAVTATEAWSYFEHRMQVADYTVPPTHGPGAAYWTTAPMAAESIAAAVVADAVAVGGSALSNLTFDIRETVANTNPIYESFPLSQLQQVSSIVSSLSSGAYMTGFDFAIDWAWSGSPGSTPEPTLTLNYPRRGRIAGTTGLVIDSSTPGSKYTWPEDGTSQAGVIYASASGAFIPPITVSDPSILSARYPLLESSQSYQTNSVDALHTAARADLARLEWPIITPTFTMPMFGSTFAIGDFLLGDDARIVINPDERFPQGLDTYLRIIELQANPADDGLSMMTLTCSTPPALAPVSPPPF